LVDAGVALGEADVGALLAEQFPDLPGPTRLLGEGEDFRAFERGGLVFRFPRRAETANWLQTEMRVLARIGDRLGVAVPRYLYLGQPGPRFPFVFGGYPLLRGTPASLLLPTPRLAAGLGAFLTALHGSEAEGVPDRRHLWAPGRHLVRLQNEAGPSLRELPPALRERCSAFLDATKLPAECPAPCLIHGDLEAEHLLLDDSGSLAAVLDWSDVCLGDPARDLGGLWAWGGEDFLAELLHHYPARDPGLLSRIRFLGRCYALLDHVEALAEDERGRGLAIHQLENAFPETP
jgi:aminoglycoside phosphotransferase (APT) family kinase protein